MPVSGARLTELEQKLHYYPGNNPSILVAAPHHGYQRGCDYYTKEFSAILAAHLGATLVVADGLRPLVDLNKEPSRADTPELQNLCLTYQKCVLADPVHLFLEVHGHVHGCYDLELSCGSNLDPTLPFDRELGDRLNALGPALHGELDKYWRSWFPLPSPSVGIFPFDQQVVMKATKTFLFQKIRLLQLGGRRIFGLHIEVYRDYKTGDTDSPYAACQQTLAEALAFSINKSFLTSL